MEDFFKIHLVCCTILDLCISMISKLIAWRGIGPHIVIFMTTAPPGGWRWNSLANFWILTPTAIYTFHWGVFLWFSAGPEEELPPGEEEGSQRVIQCSQGPQCGHYVWLAEGSKQWYFLQYPVTQVIVTNCMICCIVHYYNGYVYVSVTGSDILWWHSLIFTVRKAFCESDTSSVHVKCPNLRKIPSQL